MPTFVTRTDVSPGTTGSWVDVDLSSLIASGSTGVTLRVVNSSAIASVAVGWRKKGSTDNRTGNLYLLSQTQVHVGVDASRVVQVYRGSTDATFLLEASWGSEAVFFDNAVSKTPGSGYSWTAASIASDTGADTAIAAFVEFAGTWAALRKTGSTDNRTASINAHMGGMIGVNGSESFDYQTEGGSNPIFVLGYLKSGATIATNGTDRSTATTGSYVDVTAFASGNAAALYEMVSTGSGAVAVRKKGDSGDIYQSAGGQNIGWFVIEGDGSRVTQQKIAATDSDLWEIGVFEAPAAPPAAPTGVTAGSITASGATISWTDASGDETGFKVQTAPSPYTTWTTASGSPTAANATSLAVTGLTDGTSYKARVASTNGSGDSAWVESGVFTTLSLTRLRPNADTTVGSATSTGANLFGVLDETVADDADYITIPGTLTSISLVQGHPSETNIKTWTPSPGATFATSTLTMTSGEASAITNYSDLYVKIVTSSTTVKMKFENATDPANDNDHALVIRLRTA